MLFFPSFLAKPGDTGSMSRPRCVGQKQLRQGVCGVKRIQFKQSSWPGPGWSVLCLLGHVVSRSTPKRGLRGRNSVSGFMHGSAWRCGVSVSLAPGQRSDVDRHQ